MYPIVLSFRSLFNHIYSPTTSNQPYTSVLILILPLPPLSLNTCLAIAEMFFGVWCAADPSLPSARPSPACLVPAPSPPRTKSVMSCSDVPQLAIFLCCRPFSSPTLRSQTYRCKVSCWCTLTSFFNLHPSYHVKPPIIPFIVSFFLQACFLRSSV